jgi:hypothetical protein
MSGVVVLRANMIIVLREKDEGDRRCAPVVSGRTLRTVRDGSCGSVPVRKTEKWRGERV